jgi:large subunit ribosomal protein L22
MAKVEQPQLKEVKAFLGDLQMSPRKVRLVTDLVKHKSVAEAIVQLQLISKKAAYPILKLVNSAVANASNNFKLNPALLVIKNITVDQGRTTKRFKPRAQGRAMPIRHKISKVLVILVEDKTLKGKHLQPTLAAKRSEVEARETTGEDRKVDQGRKPGSPPQADLRPQAPKKAEVKRRLFNRKTNA